MKRLIIIVISFLQLVAAADKLLIPMDQIQKDHLKAYGIAFWTLEKNINIEWLLNYRGGSFLIDYYSPIAQECRIRGVSFNRITANGVLDIYTEIEQNNMDIVLLEKAPRIAIYTPQNKQPWDDAVTLALTYAEVPIKHYGMRKYSKVN